MADTTEKMSMSTALNKGARFCAALLDDGVKPSELQRVIDDPDLRRQVVILLHGDPYAILPDHFDVALKLNTICGLFRLRWVDHDDDQLPLMRDQQHWEEPEDWQKPWIEHFTRNENFRELLTHLTPRQLQVILWVWDNPDAKQKDKAEQFGISTGRIRDIETTSFQKLRNLVSRTIDEHKYAEARTKGGLGQHRVADLGLSERTINCLRRARINTVEQLIEYRAADLLGITNFGQRCLDEVVSKLDELGLCLKP